LLSASAVSLGVVAAISAMSTEVIGVGDFTTSVMVREPVTVMTPSSSPESSFAGLFAAGPASWDHAAPDPRAAATASAMRDAPFKHREFIFSPFPLNETNSIALMGCQ
jgi:hypothetical protein